MKEKRDSKDPMPTCENSKRIGGGNDPAPPGEKHNQKKSERIKGDQRFTLRTGGEDQPARKALKPTKHGRPQSGGNLPVVQAVESHNQGKAEHVKESQRW